MIAHARPLAERLAAASDAELTELFRAREVRTDAGFTDFFDVAESLLDPASVQRALPRLTGDEAAALHRAASESDAGTDAETDAAAHRDALIRLALLQADGTPYPSVTTAVLDRAAPVRPEPTPPLPSSDEAAAHAAERALTTIDAVAGLVLHASEKPLTLLSGGAVGAGEKKMLAEQGVPVDTVDHLVALAVDAQLATRDGRVLCTTAAAAQWLICSAADRWSALVQGLRDALPRGIRTPSGGWTPPASWPHAYPWDSGWPGRCRALHERTRLLALIADDDSEPSWAAAIRAGALPDATELMALLPAEVDRIFLQNDLTAISPGPLAPALDIRLRAIAERESAAQASSYRFTAESIAHALIMGETERSIIDFLEALSLTGIPQTLRYLIAQTAQRHGLVRVSTDAETGRTRIESVDHHLIQAMHIDQALRPLGLSLQHGSLTTRVNRDTVYCALTDARYPATIVDEDGQATAGERHPLASTYSAERSCAHTGYESLVAALRAHQGPDADAAWLDRELDAAVRAKAVLKVAVGLPDGSTRELIIQATGLGGGRLRGRDRTADVERTLPVSSIRSATVIAE
ncbi:MAG: helicase-associated domain-containing protein [Microbacterium sp.]